jgi:3'(2'), 5'-bisphosphate nucleotidase
MTKDVVSEVTLREVVDIAAAAGKEIMAVVASGDLGTRLKADDSPLTRADLASNRVIVTKLQELTPEIPVISEESRNAAPKDRMANRFVWLVDPLDGTKGFVKHSKEFTVNIALVRDGESVLGVVDAPALELRYFGGKNLGAWRQNGKQKPEPIQANSLPETPVITLSRSGRLKPEVAAYLKRIPEHRIYPASSSVKFCYVADGTADIYPQFHDCWEWDTAAGDAILRAAGGVVHEVGSGEPVRYNKSDLASPQFVAATPKAFATHDLLSEQ